MTKREVKGERFDDESGLASSISPLPPLPFFRKTCRSFNANFDNDLACICLLNLEQRSIQKWGPPIAPHGHFEVARALISGVLSTSSKSNILSNENKSQ